MANFEFVAEENDDGSRRPADEFTVLHFQNCLKANAFVGATFVGAPPFTQLVFGEGCPIFIVRGNPLSLNPEQFRIFPIQPGGAPSASAAPSNAAAATAAGEIDGFSIVSEDETGALVSGVEVSGLAPLTAAEFLSILTDGAGFAERFESLFDGADRFTGGGQGDGFTPGAGNDTVSGLGGDDAVFKSRAGALSFDGGAGSDTLAFRAATGDVFPTAFTGPAFVDLAAGTGTSPYGGALTLVSVENVIGTSLADTLMGDSGANVFGDGQFDTGADMIDGRGGDDTVKIAPETTGKRADGGAGTDTLFFQFDRFVNRLDLTDQSQNSGVFGGGTFTNFEVFERGTDFIPFDSRLEFVGDDAAQILSFAAGDTEADLGGGDDTLVLRRSSGVVQAEGGAGVDEARLLLGFGGAALDLANPAAGGGAGVNAALTGFERFIAFDESDLKTAFIFHGDGAAQFAAGAGGTDELDGRGGNDSLSGGAGRDLLLGGGGNDMLRGDGGRDRAEGEGGRDRLDGGGGGDTLLGGGGADILLGGGGADRLVGGGGKDRIEPGKGRDALEGGGGRDVFAIGRGDGVNRILDFQQGRDRIEIRSGAESFADLAIAQTGADVSMRFANVRLIIENQAAGDFDARDFLF